MHSVDSGKSLESTPLPEEVRQSWRNRKGPAVLVSVDGEGVPNAVYVESVDIFRETCFVVADNYFHKTKHNILQGSKGALLFIDAQGKAYQCKGAFEYQRSGEVFDFMKKLNPPKFPGHAAVVLLVDEIFTGAERVR
jgi:hypothetical protein